MPDTKEAARAAHLRYVSDNRPGITRVWRDDGWDFIDTDGSVITDPDNIARIKKLAIPPAYADVWICRDPRGHLQAVGRDARGRKQYRYHPKWREVRDEAKYGNMLVFGRVLPAIRARVKHDLARAGLPKKKVLAAVVALLEKTMMRVGNEEYARTNQSFGLTTLRRKHVKLGRGHVVFDFRGKHGVEHHIDLADKKLAAIVMRCQALPGQDLFQFVDHDGVQHHVISDDVNDYLRDASGEEITAKDFRTWAVTTLAAMALAGMERFDSPVKAKHAVVEAVEYVAKKLGNTPAICRKCYIHPAVLEGYLDGSLTDGLQARAGAVQDAPESGLTPMEVAIVGRLAILAG